MIREATVEDARPIAEIVKQMKEIRSVADLTLDEVTRVVRSNLEVAVSGKGSTILVGASDAGQVLGYCAAHWTPFLFLAGGEGYVTELFVLPEARGEGMGTRLLAAIEQLGRSRGCTRLCLLNGREGEAYRRGFYAKRGWVERDKIANFILPLKR
jgi:GNAT superfamily N-acetyltransferase